MLNCNSYMGNKNNKKLGLKESISLVVGNMIGAGISALVDTLYSPLVILFAFLLLGETLNFYQILVARSKYGYKKIYTYKTGYIFPAIFAPI